MTNRVRTARRTPLPVLIVGVIDLRILLLARAAHVTKICVASSPYVFRLADDEATLCREWHTYELAETATLGPGPVEGVRAELGVFAKLGAGMGSVPSEAQQRQRHR